MHKKVCTKCGVEKDFSEFSKHKGHKDGLSSNCKQCCRESHKEWREEVREFNEKLEQENPIIDQNKKKICAKCGVEKKLSDFSKDRTRVGGFRLTCKQCDKGRCKKYYKKNAEELRYYAKQYRSENPNYGKDYAKKYYKDNVDALLDKKKGYYEENIDRIKEYQTKYYNKIKNSHKYKFKGSMRSLVNRVVRKIGFEEGTVNYLFKDVDEGRIEEIFGCTFKELKEHIESQFSDGMSWENRSEWHIDHVFPISKCVELYGDEAFHLANHYTNLQPLWAADNLSKGAKI